MGWAKYYEDNMSINEERVKFKAEQAKKMVKQVHKAKPATTKARTGLELKFMLAIEEDSIRKLQLHGWWWSKSKACWCNYNTDANREYVEICMKELYPIITCEGV